MTSETTDDLKKFAKYLAVVFLCGLAFLGFLKIVSLMIKPSPTAPVPTAQTKENPRAEAPLSPGEKALTNQLALIAIDDPSWDAMNEAIGTGNGVNDKAGLMSLMLDGKVFSVERGTNVNVLDIGFTSTKVRILDGPEQGKAGWVIREHLSRK